MSIKKGITVLAAGFILSSCSSRGWSCKARYVNAKQVATEKKIA